MQNFKKFSIIIPLALFLFACTSQTEKSKGKTEQISTQIVDPVVATNQNFEIVDNEKVCMVNDRFMVVKQIPIDVDGITYYGCCPNCVKKIQENIDGVRYSTDPVSGEKVDKATAIIVQDKKTGFRIFK